ncbi:HPr kinase/phosphorylase [Parvibaculum sp.]|jgi:HPr kinase/phosphorylase|uniref:HPr kinase/phosphorylase n=1 Tax=Parvibaculum sp. TaxID=2024848 RepID=UPI003C7684A2
MSDAPLYLHGTCIACGTRGALLRGASGSGKSDLAFRMIREDESGETRLVADDQVVLHAGATAPLASAPAILSGLIELRGLGLLSLTPLAEVSLALIVDLVPREEVPRIAERRYEKLLGFRLPVIALHAFDGTAALKLRLALETLPEGGFPEEDGRFGRRD